MFAEGVAAVKNGKWGYINTSVRDIRFWKMTLPFCRVLATMIISGACFCLYSGNSGRETLQKYGYVAIQGTEVLPFRFDYTSPVTKKLALVGEYDKTSQQK